MTQRINYIDVSKGVCILLVMLIHIGVPEPIPNISIAKVPLFFILSGFFFKDDQKTFAEKTLKGYKRLIIPFLFFYLLSYLLYYVAGFLYPPFYEMTEASGILDCFTQKQYFNGPLWFLPCLFIVQLLTNGILALSKQTLVRTVLVVIVGCAGFLLSVVEIDLPLAADTAMVAVPLFLLGFWSNKLCLFKKYGIILLCASLGVYAIAYFSSPFDIAMSLNRYNVNIFFFYALCIFFSFMVILFCKMLIPNNRYIAYIGRNTLLLLCTHHIIYRPVKLVLWKFVNPTVEPYLTLVFTLIICLLLVPIFERWLPWAIGKSVISQRSS